MDPNLIMVIILRRILEGWLLNMIQKLFYSAYKTWRHTGKPLVNWNVYWPAIGNLVCVFAYHWSFVFYDVIFYRQYKKLRPRKIFNFCFKFCTSSRNTSPWQKSFARHWFSMSQSSPMYYKRPLTATFID